MIIIRLVKEEELSIIASILKRAYNSLNIGESWSDKESLNLIKWFYTNQSDLFFVAEDKNKIVGGIVALIKPWWDGNHLTDGEIFVDPDNQKKGIGKELIRSLFKTAKDKYQAVSWDTFTHIINEHPLSWYKKLGFEEIKHWQMITGDINKVLAKLS